MLITSQYAIALLLSAAISLALSLYAFRRRNASGSTYFALLMIAVAEWSIAAALEAYVSEASAKILLSKISYIGIAACPLLFLIFVLKYVHNDRAISRRIFTLLSIIPVATIAMAFTNDLHGLLWPSFSPGPAGSNILIYGHGTWFWVNVAYSYAILVAITIMLALQLARSPKLYRRQAFTILLGSLVPWAGNVMYVSGLDPLAGLDLAPMLFSICGIVLSVGIYRFRLFDIVPVARNRLFNILKGGVLVADARDRIIDINSSAQNILAIEKNPIGRPVADFLRWWPKMVERLGGKDEMQEEMPLGESGGALWVETQISKIRDRDGTASGWLLLIIDITERKKAEWALRESEERYKTFFRTARDCVFITSAEGKWIDCNDAAVEFFGFSSKGELIGKPTPSLYENPKDRDRLREIINKDKFVKDFSTRLKKNDGSIMDVMITVAERTDANGNFSGYQGIITDVTARRQAERLLARSEEQYRLLAENSLDVIWTLDNDLKFTYISPSIKSLRGISHEEAMRESIEDTMPPESFEKVAKSMQELIEKEPQGYSGKEQRLFEIQQKRKDGSLIWVEIQAQLILDTAGKRIGILGISRNIGDRKRTENLIAARLRMLEFSAARPLKDSIQNAIDEAERITGSKVGFYHFVEPDQKTLSLQAWSTRTSGEFCTAKGEGMHYGIDKAGVWVDCVHQRRAVIHNDYASLPNKKGMPEGHAKLNRELLVPIFRDGLIVAIMGMGNKETDYNEDDVKTVSYLADIAWEIAKRKRAEEALRESERLYRSYIDLTGQIGWITNARGEVEEDIPSWRNFTGQSYDEVKGQGWAKAIHPDDLDHTLGVWKNAVAAKNMYEVEYRIRRHDGAYRNFLARGIPVLEDNGAIKEWIGTCMDITERKRAQEVQTELEAIRRTSKMKDQFIALATHELHIPIAALKGYTEMLLSGKGGAGELSDVARGLLETIGRNTDRLMRLVDNLLDLQRMESEAILIDKKKIDLKKIVASCAKNVEGAIKAKKQNLQINAGKGDFEADCDEKKIETVICALLDNASKFTPERGSIRIDVNEDKKDVKVSVSDNGIGIPKDALARVFRPFANIEKPDYFRGAGLSLSVAKGIMDAHGGKITAESEGEGKGAKFTIILPKLSHMKAST